MVRNEATAPDKTQAGMMYDCSDVRASNFITLQDCVERSTKSVCQDPITTVKRYLKIKIKYPDSRPPTSIREKEKCDA